MRIKTSSPYGKILPPSLNTTGARVNIPEDIAAPCRSVSEVAGLWPGNKVLRYARQHVRAQWVQQLFGDMVFSLGAEAGIMLPLGKGWRSTSTCICERCAAARCCCQD